MVLAQALQNSMYLGLNLWIFNMDFISLNQIIS